MIQQYHKLVFINLFLKHQDYKKTNVLNKRASLSSCGLEFLCLANERPSVIWPNILAWGDKTTKYLKFHRMNGPAYLTEKEKTLYIKHTLHNKASFIKYLNKEIKKLK